jgi:DNA polymerase-3 subunit gamma/tau
MSYLVLARKYRPQVFEEVIQQEHVTRTLSNAIVSDRMAHALLFSGPRGTGKTTVARILAKAMNCLEGPRPEPCNSCRSCIEITASASADVFEIDGASNNNVDQVRELRENVKFMPAYGRYKIYIIDEVHMLSNAAFNALLKTLEEPPDHVMFIFATTEPHKIPITIQSRCQRHDFRRIGVDAVTNHMHRLCEQEETEIDDSILTLIAHESGGSIRDSLSLLDQVITCVKGGLDQQRVMDILGIVDQQLLGDVSKALLNGDVSKSLAILEDIYARGHDLKKFFQHLIQQFRNLLVVKIAQKPSGLVDLLSHEIELLIEIADKTSTSVLSDILNTLIREESLIRFSTQPKISLEMLFIRLAATKPSLSIETLIENLEILRKEIIGSDEFYENSGESASTVQDSNQRVENKPIEIVKQPENLLGKSLKSVWTDVEKILSKDYPLLGANLKKSELVFENDSALSVLVKGNGFTAAHLGKHIETLKEICTRLTGKSEDIRLAVVKEDPESDDWKKSGEGREKQDAVNHPLVSDVLEIFKAKIVDVKIIQEVNHERHG